MMDFPGDGLISSIISLNFKKLSGPPPLWAILSIALCATLFGVVLSFFLIHMFKLGREMANRPRSASQEVEPEKVPYSRF